MSTHIIAQLAASAGILSDLYTVPALMRAMLRITVTNRNVSAGAFRIAVAPGGAADDPKHYVAYDETIGGLTSVTSVPLALAAGDVVRVRGNNSDMSFTLTGLVSDA